MSDEGHRPACLDGFQALETLIGIAGGGFVTLDENIYTHLCKVALDPHCDYQ
jgi:hypothetical protein